jgi:hypothetical protein
VPAAEVVQERLVGCDIDPAAVVAARAALRCWAVGRGVDDTFLSPRVLVVDALAAAPGDWTRDADLVVGNPPFLAQRTTDTARDEQERQDLRSRFGVVGPYTDTSALFLLCALDLLAPDGVAVMIQPQSLLAARDAAGVRGALLERAALVGLWGSDRRPFDADVDVCAPVLARRRDRPRVELRWGPGAERVGMGEAPAADRSWGPLLAGCLGVPEVPAPSARAHLLGDVATTTAGFRDEFYALAAAARDPGEQGWSAHAPRLVTVGMIDPGRSSWGSGRRRLGGRSVVAPRLDRHALHRDAPRVATWAAHRMVPKVMVATQTRIVEAAIDPCGDCIPVTPVISVEPLGSDRSAGSVPDVWALGAALLAPPVAARAVATHLGSGLSVGSIRWSARAVRDVALPTERRAWVQGAELVQRLAGAGADDRDGILAELAPLMTRAHGLAGDHPVAGWWLERALRA